MAKKRKGLPVHGWVVLDKPSEIGSTPCVGKVRYAFQAQKVGHAGTLDPLASGILPIALGEATKTVPFIMDGTKEYDFTVTWGTATDSLDSDGKVTGENDRRPTEEAIIEALPSFVGTISQKPPEFSAIKVQGQRAYDLARLGELVKLAARNVEVFDLQLIGHSENESSFRTSCGKGTYIRSIARDMAEKLGCLGHISVLRRTRVGPFSLKDAISLETLTSLGHIGADHGCLLPVSTALDDISALAISESEARSLRNGQTLSLAHRPLYDKVQNLGSNVCWAKVGRTPIAMCEVIPGAVKSTRVFNL